MNKVEIFDTTLRDGEQAPSCSMNIKEKIEMAIQLEKLGVDAIEAGFASSSSKDFEAIVAISKAIKTTTIVSLSRLLNDDIDCSIKALEFAKKPRLHLFIATSDIHLKYKLKMSQEEILVVVKEKIEYAKKFISDIEFSAEDASRTDKEFLAKVFKIAVKAGANIINIPDTVGFATPQEMFSLVNYIKNEIADENIKISVHCHNDLGLGVACSLAAVRGGATQIECTVNGIGERAGNAPVEEIAMALKTRGDVWNMTSNIDTTKIYRISKLVSSIVGIRLAPNKPVVGANAFVHESGIHQHGILQDKATYE
ncbi:MAG: 2-isopropylmalate synthase, partial [Oscillospiraceae bacterium]